MRKALILITLLIAFCICGCTETPRFGKVTWYGPDGIHVWENANDITIQSTGEFNFQSQGKTLSIFGNVVIER